MSPDILPGVSANADPFGRHRRAVQNLKVLMLTDGGINYGNMLKYPIISPGVINWPRALGAEWAQLKELSKGMGELENYDVVMINLAGTDLTLPQKVRAALGRNSSTKIVTWNDYSIETLQRVIIDSGTSYYNYLLSLLASDVLLAQETFEYNLMEYVINQEAKARQAAGDRSRLPKLAMISHPCDTRLLKQLAQKKEMRMPWVSVMYHKSEGHVHLPSLLTRNLPHAWHLGISPYTFLWGYTDVVGDKVMFGKDELFNFVGHYQAWPQFASMFPYTLVALDYYAISSHSRFASEVACLEVPLVSTTHAYNATQLFPDTTHHYRNLSEMRASLERLLTDEEYWNKTVQYAWENVEQFNYENCAKKLLVALENDKETAQDPIPPRASPVSISRKEGSA